MMLENEKAASVPIVTKGSDRGKDRIALISLPISAMALTSILKGITEAYPHASVEERLGVLEVYPTLTVQTKWERESRVKRNELKGVAQSEGDA